MLRDRVKGDKGGRMSLINKEKTMEEIPVDVCDGFEVTDIIEKMPTVKAIPLEKVKQAREEIANKYDGLANAWCEREEGKNEAILDVLEILDKLIEEVEDESNEDN